MTTRSRATTGGSATAGRIEDWSSDVRSPVISLRRTRSSTDIFVAPVFKFFLRWLRLRAKYRRGSNVLYLRRSRLARTLVLTGNAIDAGEPHTHLDYSVNAVSASDN